jgi:hypothetical protein
VNITYSKLVFGGYVSGVIRNLYPTRACFLNALISEFSETVFDKRMECSQSLNFY